MRSLHPQDFFLLRQRVAEVQSEWRPWSVAMSVWMVNGQIIVGDQESLQVLFRTLQTMPAPALKGLFRMVLRLAERVQVALDILESFFYESESRELWKSEGREVLNPGLGVMWPTTINAVQKYWVLYNLMEDDREAKEHQWSMVKFMVGPHAPKGIKKLSERDKEREQELRERRSLIQDRTYWEVLGVVKKLRGKDRDMAIRKIRKAETYDELQEEMKNWVQGNLDDHDQVIETVKNRIREDVQLRERLEIERNEALRKAMEEEANRPVGRPEVLRTLTPEEVEDFMKTPPPQQIYYPSGENMAYKKYLAAKTMSPGNLIVQGNQLVPSVPVDVESLRGLVKDDDDVGTTVDSLQMSVNKRLPQAD